MSYSEIVQSQTVSHEAGTQTYAEQTKRVGCADLVTVYGANENPEAAAAAFGANFVWTIIKFKFYQIAAGLATFAGVLA